MFWEAPYYSIFRKCNCTIKAEKGGLYALLMGESRAKANQLLEDIKTDGKAVLPLIDRILEAHGIMPIEEDWNKTGLDIVFKKFHPDFVEHLTVTPDTVYIPWNNAFISGLDNVESAYQEVIESTYRNTVLSAFPQLGDEAWTEGEFDPRSLKADDTPYFNYSSGGWSTLIEAVEHIINHLRNGDGIMPSRREKYSIENLSVFVSDVLNVSELNLSQHFHNISIQIDTSLLETSKVKWDPAEGENGQLSILLPGLYRGGRTSLLFEALDTSNGGEPPILGNLSNCSPFCGGFWNNADAHS